MKPKSLWGNNMLTYSIGELIDKLCVVHLKLWHAEERTEVLKDTDNIKEIDSLLNQVISLNELRVKIVESIDELLTEKTK
jgi:hypothetical protein